MFALGESAFIGNLGCHRHSGQLPALFGSLSPCVHSQSINSFFCNITRLCAKVPEMLSLSWGCCLLVCFIFASNYQDATLIAHFICSVLQCSTTPKWFKSKLNLIVVESHVWIHTVKLCECIFGFLSFNTFRVVPLILFLSSASIRNVVNVYVFIRVDHSCIMPTFIGEAHDNDTVRLAERRDA